MPQRTYHLIPHTHWDREWYLTRAAFQSRLVPALDDLIDRLSDLRSALDDDEAIAHLFEEANRWRERLMEGREL